MKNIFKSSCILLDERIYLLDDKIWGLLACNLYFLSYFISEFYFNSIKSKYVLNPIIFFLISIIVISISHAC